ncbi:MAG: PF20097 family protein [Phycisphaeraceae bacterium]
MDHASTVRCPTCHARMEEGFVPTGGGMQWYRKRDGGVAFAESLPGTITWLRRARLPAWRCRKCQYVLLRYGEALPPPGQVEPVVPQQATPEPESS